MKIKDGVENWQILQALANGTSPRGLGFLATLGGSPGDEDAKKFCMGRSRIYVDYYAGKPIKTQIDERPMPDFYLYDRDAGEGAGERALRAAGLIED
jgi:hypothetical protein